MKEPTLSEKELDMLREMRTHLGDLHQRWQTDPECDGHCKSNEGYVGLLFRLPNWHETKDKEEYINAPYKLSMVEVYSYLFGPNRLHQFNSLEEAYREVMNWTY